MSFRWRKLNGTIFTGQHFQGYYSLCPTGECEECLMCTCCG